jgi:glucose-6-phosphate 1-dehydrogenase
MQKPENLILVIFGASGDLTRRKLLPALYHLYKQDFLPRKYAILGTGRKAYSEKEFRAVAKESLSGFAPSTGDTESADPGTFVERIYYLPLDTADPAAYVKLKEKLERISSDKEISQHYIYYLATPPSMYVVIARSLAEQGLNSGDPDWKRIIVEKPFGYDLASSRELNTRLRMVFEEDQIYRIDHYLGKETVQNIMVTRFSNGIFEPIWNRNYISRIEITASEHIGVEDRGGYYEGSGALRDMVQNHMLQLVALVAMEPPVLAESNAIRNEIDKVLESLRPLDREHIQKDVIRAQYLDSAIRGEKVKGYRSETGVDPESRTETYVALKFYIDNWRWKDVPFYVRTGKRLPTRVTEIVIHFQSIPHHIFSRADDAVSNNQLIIRIQPDEGLLLKFGMKVPGAGYKVQTVNMDFHYSDLSDIYLPAAYERLLLDCMLGDSTLYAREDAVECAWRFVDPILQYWKDHPGHALYGYPGGTWGPPEADSMFGDEKTMWRYPCKNLTDDGNYCEL